MGLLHEIRATSGHRHVLVARLVAGLPLLAFGFLHLQDPRPFGVLLRLAGLPLRFNLVAAPVAEVLGGALLLAGFLARVGGALGVATMIPAIYATMVIGRMDLLTLAGYSVFEKPDLPPLALPVAVLLASAYVVWIGGGAFSLDARSTAGARDSI